MGQLSSSRIYKAIVGLFSALDSDDDTLLRGSMWRRTITARATDGGTAGTAQAETHAWRNHTGSAVRVVSVHVTTPVGVTANATNFATFLVAQRSAGGIGAANVATFATDTVATDDMTAFAPKALTLTDANVIVPAGSVLTVAVSKAASGAAIASATAQATFDIVIEPVI